LEAHVGGLHGVAKLLCDPGDNFIFPSPSFPYLLTIAQIHGLEPKLYNLNAEQNWEGVI
jgi:aspartate/methionine/tyrosine aminotransferase